LRPEEKLGSIMAEVTKGPKRKVKEIKYKSSAGITILDFQSKTTNSRLLLYPSVRVADNYYVFLSFQKLKERPVKYVFELTPEGDIVRSCKMD
jgi:hypothetical protein